MAQTGHPCSTESRSCTAARDCTRRDACSAAGASDPFGLISQPLRVGLDSAASLALWIEGVRQVRARIYCVKRGSPAVLRSSGQAALPKKTPQASQGASNLQKT